MVLTFLLAQLLLVCLKGGGGLWAGSMALALSSILSLGDGVSALAARPRLGERNPKVSFALMSASSGLVLLSVVGLAGVLLHRLFAHQPTSPGYGALGLALLSVAFNGALAWRLARMPDQSEGAICLEGSSRQAKLDLLVALSVLLARQAAVVDLLAATLITFLVMRSAWRALRFAAGGLLDANEAGLKRQAIAESVSAIATIRAVSQVRLYPSPTRAPVVALVVHLPPQLSFAQAAGLRPQIEAVIRQRLGPVTEVLIEYSADARQSCPAGEPPSLWPVLPGEAGQ